MKLVDQFIYLGSNILFTESNVSIHRDKVWTGCQTYRNMIFLIKSKKNSYKPYCTTWTLTKCLEKNGNYTRILHAVLKKSWKQELTKQ